MQFEAGQMYSIAEVQQHLQVGNAGGIRVSLDNQETRRVVLLTALPSAKIQRENPYHDRIEDDILVYSAAGLEGNQTLGGVNKRLVDQKDGQFPIYGFRLNESRRKSGPKRWEFLGLLQLLRYYPDSQFDRGGKWRTTWMFEFRIGREIPRVDTEHEKNAVVRLFKAFTFDPEQEERVPERHQQQDSAPRKEALAVERTRAAIFSLDPPGFEHLVKRALEASGFEEVRVTRYSQDNGIDVNARVSNTQWPIKGLHVQVQAKRWLHTVGRREVAELRGSLDPFARGALVTTSFFSRSALNEASIIGRQPIVLVDGYAFATIVREHKLA
jgi:hypothetical protein